MIVSIMLDVDKKTEEDLKITIPVDLKEPNNIDIEKISSDIPIKKGDILVSNSKYLRYEGELEIALKNLGTDEKRSIVSKITEEDMELLDYINIVKKFEFIHNDDSN